MPPRAPPAPGPRPPPRAPAAAWDADTDTDTAGTGGPGLRPLAPRPWRWLLLLALPAACSAPPPPRPVYTNHWAVQVLGGPAAADRVAAAHGYLNLGQVSATGPRARNFPGLRRARREGPPCRESPGSAARGALGGDAGAGPALRGQRPGRGHLPSRAGGEPVAGAVLRVPRACPAADPGLSAPGPLTSTGRAGLRNLCARRRGRRLRG